MFVRARGALTQIAPPLIGALYVACWLMCASIARGDTDEDTFRETLVSLVYPPRGAVVDYKLVRTFAPVTSLTDEEVERRAQDAGERQRKVFKGVKNAPSWMESEIERASTEMRACQKRFQTGFVESYTGTVTTYDDLRKSSVHGDEFGPTVTFEISYDGQRGVEFKTGEMDDPTIPVTSYMLSTRNYAQFANSDTPFTWMDRLIYGIELASSEGGGGILVREYNDAIQAEEITLRAADSETGLRMTVSDGRLKMMESFGSGSQVRNRVTITEYWEETGKKSIPKEMMCEHFDPDGELISTDEILVTSYKIDPGISKEYFKVPLAPGATIVDYGGVSGGEPLAYQLPKGDELARLETLLEGGLAGSKTLNEAINQVSGALTPSHPPDSSIPMLLCYVLVTLAILIIVIGYLFVRRRHDVRAN